MYEATFTKDPIKSKSFYFVLVNLYVKSFNFSILDIV